MKSNKHHTLLKPDASASDIDKLRFEAKQNDFAPVFINPTYVSLCHEVLQNTGIIQDTDVNVCSAVGFPLGANMCTDMKEAYIPNFINTNAPKRQLVSPGIGQERKATGVLDYIATETPTHPAMMYGFGTERKMTYIPNFITINAPKHPVVSVGVGTERTVAYISDCIATKTPTRLPMLYGYGTERKVAYTHGSVGVKTPAYPAARHGIGKPLTVPTNSTYGLKKTNLPSKLKSKSSRKIIRQGIATSNSNSSKMIDGQWEEMIDTDKELGFVNTYVDYMPAKLKVGQAHPDPTVETASLSSVKPPDITYKLSLPSDIIDQQKLSTLQLEAISYACQLHEKQLPNGKRAGFLLGDGPGMGKGRTISGIILENYILKRKRILWVSVSSDLKIDAERDLRDIGANKIKLYALNKLKYADINSSANGNIKKGVLFSTYASLIARSSGRGIYNTRLQMITEWFGPDFNGLIVFDECHRAKSLIPENNMGKPTKTAKTVCDLQEALPNARIVYVSATGATVPHNMRYMSRLGLWGDGSSFPKPGSFFNSIERKGVGAMELVAMNMKARGVYVARQLSFAGVSFEIREIEMNPNFIQVYDESVDFWTDMQKRFQKAIHLVFTKNSAEEKTIWRQFWSAHQRFFKYMCVASKVDATVKIARDAVKNGKSVVIGLQTTGEARTLEIIDQEEDRTSFVSMVKGVIQLFVENHFPRPNRVDNIKQVLEQNSLGELNVLPDESRKRKANTLPILKTKMMRLDDPISDIKNEILQRLSELGKKLPPNTLDLLVDELGGPNEVAEMTGRKRRMVKDNIGNVIYDSRANSEVTTDMLNVREREMFQSGDKNIAIISEAASSGISLHADKKALNTKRRVHITLELPWSADRVTQQLGRTHRSNQMHPPAYILLVSDLGGERRFASIVAKRLECLGALTHGDRKAGAASSLSQFNIYSEYGQLALDLLMRAIERQEEGYVKIPDNYKGNFMEDARAALVSVGMLPDFENLICKDKIARFLNKLLGVKVRLQNAIFQFYMDILAHVVNKAKDVNIYDYGILDLGEVKMLESNLFGYRHATGPSKVVLCKVEVERGITWKMVSRYEIASDNQEGFYLLNKPREGCRYGPVLATRRIKRKLSDDESFVITRPARTGEPEIITFADLKQDYHQVHAEEAKEHWEKHYEHSKENCFHIYWKGYCNNGNCIKGKRCCNYWILKGDIMTVWPKLEPIAEAWKNIQVVRMNMQTQKDIGILVPTNEVSILVETLKEDALSMDIQLE
ncbi:protein strawberry notch homolog 1-like [Artemia franciscana]|uniref:protein strawberry notch homolog 1-like n=1 Tax=Artemia franciscana TaxID=6661 RepID=UPI0032DB5BF6